MVTDMRLFAGVSAQVNGQSTPLDETLVTAFDHALIRALIGMYSIVSAEI